MRGDDSACSGVDPLDPSRGRPGRRTTRSRRAVDALVAVALDQRRRPGQRKDFAAADADPRPLKAAGIAVEDTAARHPMDLEERLPDGRQLPAPRRARRNDRLEEGRDRRLRRPDARKALRGKGPTPAGRGAHRAPGRAAGHGGGQAPATSRGDPGSRRPASRARQARPRRRAELVAGRNSVVEALRAQVPARRCTSPSASTSDDRVREALTRRRTAAAAARGAARRARPASPAAPCTRALALQVPPYDYAHPDDLLARAVDSGQAPLLVALDGVTDPRNLGAVIRSVAAFGGHGVLVPERRAAGMTAGAWKASAGAAARVPVARATNLTRSLEAYRKAGCVVVGLAADGTSTWPTSRSRWIRWCVVVGSEGRGLSRLVAETCDLLVRIPMHAGTESLNAGIAAAIVLHAVAARRALRRRPLGRLAPLGKPVPHVHDTRVSCTCGTGLRGMAEGSRASVDDWRQAHRDVARGADPLAEHRLLVRLLAAVRRRRRTVPPQRVPTSRPARSDRNHRCSSTSWKTSAGSSLPRSSRGHLAHHRLEHVGHPAVRRDLLVGLGEAHARPGRRRGR